MPAALDLAGKTFGVLRPIRRAFVRARNTYWLCRCECDRETIVSLPHLTTGHTRSCGCLLAAVRRKHGHSPHRSKSRTYATWDGMIQRCLNSNNAAYPDYGGRGIRVCKRWRDSFLAFLEDMGERPEGRTIDRIDNSGNYEPTNCRWATRSEQNSNRRPYTWSKNNPRSMNRGLVAK